jgi:hypothetical protein
MNLIEQLKAFLLAQRAAKYPLPTQAAASVDALIVAVVDVGIYYGEKALEKSLPTIAPVVEGALNPTPVPVPQAG